MNTHKFVSPCDQCNRRAVTQVTYGIAYGLYCAEHGAAAEAARLEAIHRRNGSRR